MRTCRMDEVWLKFELENDHHEALLV
jgi:hypothetical protein